MKEKLRKYIGLKLALVLAGAGFISGGLALAKIPIGSGKQGDLAISLTAKKVILKENNQEQLLEADQAMPGEIIQYDAHYQNMGTAALRNLSPTLPIPEGMVFLPSSAHPPLAAASLDGKTFQSVPITKEILLANGEKQTVEVSPTEYRALQWKLGDLKKGGQAIVTARTQINDVITR